MPKLYTNQARQSCAYQELNNLFKQITNKECLALTCFFVLKMEEEKISVIYKLHNQIVKNILENIQAKILIAENHDDMVAAIQEIMTSKYFML